VLVNVDEGNDEGVCDDMLGYGKIITKSGITYLFYQASV
jgi:hypothetical protein